MWTKMGVEVPGLSKSDLAELNKVIKDNPTYEAFANELYQQLKVMVGLNQVRIGLVVH